MILSLFFSNHVQFSLGSNCVRFHFQFSHGAFFNPIFSKWPGPQITIVKKCENGAKRLVVDLEEVQRLERLVVEVLVHEEY